MTTDLLQPGDVGYALHKEMKKDHPCMRVGCDQLGPRNIHSSTHNMSTHTVKWQDIWLCSQHFDEYFDYFRTTTGAQSRVGA